MPSRQTLRYIRKQDSNRSAYKQRERIIQRELTKRLNSYGVTFHNDWAAGAYLTAGQNTSKKTMDSNLGWVDLFVAEPKHGYHGLFVELKKEGEVIYRKDGTLRKNDQIHKEHAFLERMAHKGYKAVFAIGYEEAWQILSEYLDLPRQLAFDDDIF